MPARTLICSLLTAVLVACGGVVDVADTDRAFPAGEVKVATAAAAVPDAAPNPAPTSAPTPIAAPAPAAAPAAEPAAEPAPEPAGTAAPADAGARTRAGRYATAEQAQALESLLGNRVIRVDVGCCDATEADMAVLMAFVSQAGLDLPNSTPVLVQGRDLRMAAVVADRLADAGMTRVWLVVQ